jgi:flagellar hook-basal body complex protein FliE
MVERIGQGTSLARAAIEAALARQKDAARQASAMPAPLAGVASPAAPGAIGVQGAEGSGRSEFSRVLGDGLRAIDSEVKRADRLADDVVTGKVVDFHEAAAVLKQSELSLKFALEVRNKFVDAYREVMRMSV